MSACGQRARVLQQPEGVTDRPNACAVQPAVRMANARALQRTPMPMPMPGAGRRAGVWTCVFVPSAQAGLTSAAVNSHPTTSRCVGSFAAGDQRLLPLGESPGQAIAWTRTPTS
eukprot:scaffold22942_cov64-Phaeocystis_antarctica.AAC.6